MIIFQDMVVPSTSNRYVGSEDTAVGIMGLSV